MKYIMVFGILYSSVYMMFSLGLSLAFGVARIAYLAYGALYTLAAYMTYLFFNHFHLPAYVSMILSVLSVSVVSAVINELIVKPALKFPVSILMSTFAVAYLIEDVIKNRMGLTPITLPSLTGVRVIAGVPVNEHWFLVLATSFVLLFLLYLFLNHTVPGKTLRAVAESWEESMIIGVNPLRVLRITMIIVGFYAASAGVLLSPLKAVTPNMGWSPLFTALAIVILGGMGSIRGTIIAAIIYGFVEQTLAWTMGSGIASIAPLIVIVATLVIRPRGLFGEEV